MHIPGTGRPDTASSCAHLFPNTSSKLRRQPLLYGHGCIRSFSYISMVVQLAASMLACMMRKPARLTANALLMTTAMKHIAVLHQHQQQRASTISKDPRR